MNNYIGIYSVWPFILYMCLILFIASTPLLKWADAPATSPSVRIQSIDGLRGFLALSVVFHHIAIYHDYLRTGVWRLPPTQFYANIGQSGVAMFFMITGYLFWAQMIKYKGKPDFIKLYTGRIFRIVPLYTFLVIIMLLIVGTFTYWTPRESIVSIIIESIKWLSFAILPGDNINKFAMTKIITARVTWSLHYEWIFYISLIATSLFIRNKYTKNIMPPLMFTIAVILLQFNPDVYPCVAAMTFSTGIITAWIKNSTSNNIEKIPKYILSIGAIICLFYTAFIGIGVFNVISIISLSIAFICIIFDATIFGLLTTKSANRVGNISYGIYLLQGPVLFILYQIPLFNKYAVETVWGHWGVAIIVLMVLLLLATITHKAIERPGIMAGRWVYENIKLIRRER